MTQTPSRRATLAGIGASAAALGVPGGTAAAPRAPVLNDASRLNSTPVFKHWVATPSTDKAFLARLRAELREASAAGRALAVGGARHSMGGQSLPQDGAAVTLVSRSCHADTAARTYRVAAGTRWRDVIAALRPLGFSPKVTQSNHDFSVAGTFCVNAHGWAVPFGPAGSTVRRLSVMLADGSVVACSRTEEPELFRLAMGGYGLYGVILDLELEMVADLALTPRVEVMPSAEFGARFAQLMGPATGVRMAYGRLSPARLGFLSEAVMVSYRAAGGEATPGDPAPNPAMGAAARTLYRAQRGSEAWKRARWFAETEIAPAFQSKPVSRNALLNHPVSELANREPGRTDILHEYFVPPARLEAFLAACRVAISPSDPELLNVTLRYVAADPESVLAYAPAPRIAAVMSFSQVMNPEGEKSMRRMTERLIDAALAQGGGFYLPYRLHARPDQLARAYPKLAEAVRGKRIYDPKLLFRNAMWDQYFARQ